VASSKQGCRRDAKLLTDRGQGICNRATEGTGEAAREILLALVDEDRHGYAILQAVEDRVRKTLPLRTGTTVFGKTLETVLSERPCRVIIESVPDGRGAAHAGVPAPGQVRDSAAG
jgi:hypothetical protein